MGSKWGSHIGPLRLRCPKIVEQDAESPYEPWERFPSIFLQSIDTPFHEERLYRLSKNSFEMGVKKTVLSYRKVFVNRLMTTPGHFHAYGNVSRGTLLNDKVIT
jgi:hypothetical protein